MAGGNVALEDGAGVVQVVGTGAEGDLVGVESVLVLFGDEEGVGFGLCGVGFAQEGLVIVLDGVVAGEVAMR